MSFTTSFFIVGLLPWFILLCFLLRNKKGSKRILILLANFIFYAWGGIGAFLFVLVFSLLVWCFAIVVSKTKKKIILAGVIAVTVCPLLMAKYTVFIISVINGLFNISVSAPQIIIPLGISFYTFEAVSFICDVYKGKIAEGFLLTDVILYVTFFPTVTSGPIMRFNDFKSGLVSSINGADYSRAIERIIIGLSKKVLIADKIGVLADYYYTSVGIGKECSATGLWIGSIAYTIQIYYDFSGYSDMAIGMGKLLGFDIAENFDKPYRVRTISDFWRKWHISLGQWFRDYVYIPLGGNKCSVFRHIINLLIVWLLTGIWHGADWSFIVWGIGYFILLTVEKYILPMKRIRANCLGNVYTLFFVNLLWIPFRALDLKIACAYILGMFGVGSNSHIEDISLNMLPYLIVAIILCMPLEKLFYKFENKKAYSLIKGGVILALGGWAVCAVINSSYAPYIYGNF